MLEFSVLTSILRAYGKVITLKHETNNILFVICCIVKLQRHEGIIKTQIYYTAGYPIFTVCPIYICSSYLMPACFYEMP